MVDVLLNEIELQHFENRKYYMQYIYIYAVYIYMQYNHTLLCVSLHGVNFFVVVYEPMSPAQLVQSSEFSS